MFSFYVSLISISLSVISAHATETVSLKAQIAMDVCEKLPGGSHNCFELEGPIQSFDISLFPQGGNPNYLFGFINPIAQLHHQSIETQVEVRKLPNGKYYLYGFMLSPRPDEDGLRQCGGGKIYFDSVSDLLKTEFECKRVFLPGRHEIWIKLRINKT